MNSFVELIQDLTYRVNDLPLVKNKLKDAEKLQKETGNEYALHRIAVLTEIIHHLTFKKAQSEFYRGNTDNE